MAKVKYIMTPRVSAYMQRAGHPPDWWSRWMAHVSIAWTPGGEIIHQKDPDAPFGTLARYGFLLPLYDERVSAAADVYKVRHGYLRRYSLPDDARREFEREFILANRGNEE